MSEKTKLNTKAVHLILCIFFAFFLWFYVSYVVFPEVTRPVTNITVTVIGEDKLNDRGLSAKLVSDDKVDVKVTAKRTLFKDITLKNARATIDVSSINEAGTVTLKASVAFLSVPSSSAVINTDKAEVTFLVETYGKKELAVTADVVKEPTDGYYRNGDPLSDGDMLVTVSGIKADVDKVTGVKTEKIDLSDAKENITKPFRLIPIDEDGKEVDSVKLSAQHMSLTFEIYKEAPIPLSVELTEDIEDVEFTLEPSEVRLRGPAEIMDNLPPISVKYRSPGWFTIPEGLELCEGETNTYKITVDNQ